MSPLFVPGPVDVDPDVLKAQSRRMLPHRSAEFEEIFHRCLANSKKIFKTRGKLFLSTSSGTGLQEAGVRNFANSKILSCVNGAFGRRWHDVAVLNGKDARKLEFPWGQPVSPAMVSEALKDDHYEIITVVHNETSTGVENPIGEISQAVHDASPDTLVCVDAVSSVGGVLLDTDGWNLDYVLTSSQKALACPPGLSLCAVSDRALERAGNIPDRGWYFDLLRLDKHVQKNSTPATPALSLIFALDVQLSRILTEGLENRFARHKAMAEKTQSWAVENGFRLYAQENYRSNTVTTIENTRDLDINSLNDFLLTKDMQIANGYGILKNKTFRIAHMGELQIVDMENLFLVMDDYLSI